MLFIFFFYAIFIFVTFHLLIPPKNPDLETLFVFSKVGGVDLNTDFRSTNEFCCVEILILVCFKKAEFVLTNVPSKPNSHKFP